MALACVYIYVELKSIHLPTYLPTYLPLGVAAGAGGGGGRRGGGGGGGGGVRCDGLAALVLGDEE